MKRFISLALATLVLCAVLPMAASASFDYSFSAVPTTEYLPATEYAAAYGAEYIYGGMNACDLCVPDLPYGNLTPVQPGIMEKLRLPGLQESVIGNNGYAASGYAVTVSGGQYSGAAPSTSDTGDTSFEVKTTQFTQLTDSFLLSNGAIGSVSIPALGIKNMYVWQGETTESMAKGLGHFVSSSVWDGNVALCGHNRGATYVIGGIKDMQLGDTLTYTTFAGTRTYEVVTITTISNNDWTYLKETSDNRLTLVTCVSGDYGHRWLLQAVEI